MSGEPLRTVDAAERMQRLKFAIPLGITTFFLLSLVNVALVKQGRISPAAGLVLFVLNVPLTALIVRTGWRLTGGAASGLASMLYAGGNLPPEPQHSAQESLVARGFYAEAAESFLAHLAQHPGDNAARIKLATLYAEHLADPATAERFYLEARQHQPTPGQETLVSHLLIELYRKTGQRGRQLVELARFAERHRGTRAGQDAARRLKEMKLEDREPRDPGAG